MRKPLYTLESDANVNPVALGAKPLRPDSHPFSIAAVTEPAVWSVADMDSPDENQGMNGG